MSWRPVPDPLSELPDEIVRDLARLGTATVYEASGRVGLIEIPLIQIVPGSRVAGRARTVRCAQNDNLMVHAFLAGACAGDVMVLSMPTPEPVALIGELLATQAKVHGVAAILVDAATRDREELVGLGLPIWTRFVSVRGAAKETAGVIDQPVVVGGAEIRFGDVVVLDADGAVVVSQERIADVTKAALDRAERERLKRAKLEAGVLSYDIDGLRARVETVSNRQI